MEWGGEGGGLWGFVRNGKGDKIFWEGLVFSFLVRNGGFEFFKKGVFLLVRFMGLGLGFFWLELGIFYGTIFGEEIFR